MTSISMMGEDDEDNDKDDDKNKDDDKDDGNDDHEDYNDDCSDDKYDDDDNSNYNDDTTKNSCDAADDIDKTLTHCEKRIISGVQILSEGMVIYVSPPYSSGFQLINSSIHFFIHRTEM